MTPQKLSESVAFSEGSDLWVFCDPAHSAFARKIDFYLNFQMARAQQYQPKEFGPGLRAILSENQLEELAHHPKPSNRRLLSTRRKLPCRYVIVVLWNQSAPAWMSETLEIWKQLGRPTIRLFLPTAMASFDIGAVWPSEANQQISYVAGDLQLDA